MPPGADGDDWLMLINELFQDNLAPIRKDIANLVETTGDLVEVTTRQQIAKMLGDFYVPGAPPPGGNAVQRRRVHGGLEAAPGAGQVRQPGPH